MQTYHYLLGLFILATIGFVLAMRQDLKPSTNTITRRWMVWMVVMAILMIGDFAIMRAFIPQ